MFTRLKCFKRNECEQKFPSFKYIRKHVHQLFPSIYSMLQWEILKKNSLLTKEPLLEKKPSINNLYLKGDRFNVAYIVRGFSNQKISHRIGWYRFSDVFMHMLKIFQRDGLKLCFYFKPRFLYVVLKRLHYVKYPKLSMNVLKGLILFLVIYSIVQNVSLFIFDSHKLTKIYYKNSFTLFWKPFFTLNLSFYASYLTHERPRNR